MKSKLKKIIVMVAGVVLAATTHGAYVYFTVTISDPESCLNPASVSLYNSGGFGTPVDTRTFSTSWTVYGGSLYARYIDASTQYFLVFSKDGKYYKTEPFYAECQDSGSYKLTISITSQDAWEWSDVAPEIDAPGCTWTDPDLGITWKYTIHDGEVSLGSGDWRDTAVPQTTSGTVDIPDSIDGYPVTSIGEYAFCRCYDITDVTIPDSVGRIEDNAFYDCSGLTNMTMRGNAPTVGAGAFSHVPSDCIVHISRQASGYEVDADGKWQGMTVEYYGPEFIIDANGVLTKVDLHGATEVVIPDSVTSIGNYAFSKCSELSSLTIPDSVTSIGIGAFYGCSGLTRLTIPRGVNIMGSHVFYGCTGLADADGFIIVQDVLLYCLGDSSDVSIPDNVTRIEQFAFQNCQKLVRVEIPESVASIGHAAFWNCTNLASVSIPESVTSIGVGAFSSCDSLLSIDVAAGNANYSSIDGLLLSKDGKTLVHGINGNVTIPDCVTCIGSGAFESLDNLTSVTITSSVTSIEDGAFNNCNGLTSVTISDSVMSIGNFAFEGCSGLISVNIGNSVASVGVGAFYDCGNLTSVAFGKSVTSIGNYAFLECIAMTNVTMRGNAPNVGDGAFDGIGENAVVHLLRAASGYDVDAGGKWQGMTVEYYGPEFTIDANGVLTKVALYGATEVVIPKSVKSIGEGAFQGCSGLTSVTIPGSVTSIGDWAFQNCSSLTSVMIPNSVTNIGEAAFRVCSGLTRITIGNSVTDIGCGAFAHCSGLTSVTIPNSVTSIVDYAFFNCRSLTSVTIPESVTSIGEEAFANCRSLTSVTIPESVTSIGEEAFAYCWWLRSLTIPESVTSIGEEAFAHCGLRSLTIPNSVTSIADGAFYDCSGLTSLTIGNGVTNIGDSAFYYCCELTSVTIPDSVTSIGGKAFYECYYLRSVTIPNSVKSIGEEAFYECISLTSVTMKGDCPIVGSYAFSDLDLSCVVRLPKGNVTYDVVDGKWQGMRVAWYGGAGEMVLTANGQMLDFVATSDNLSIRTSTVAEGTAADDIVIMSGSNDVTKGYSRKVEGTTATIALLNPYEVPKEEGAADATWTEDGDGNVTLNVEVVPGLYYAAASAASLDALKCPGADSPATAETTLTVEKPESDTQCFFKVWVSDEAIKAE